MPHHDLLAGTKIEHPGVYVAQHNDPSHAAPHEVYIPIAMFLPMCNKCSDVRFNLKRLPVELIQDNEFFK